MKASDHSSRRPGAPPPYRSRTGTGPSRRTTLLVLAIAIVLAALSLYTVWTTRNTVAPPDRGGSGYSKVH